MSGTTTVNVKDFKCVPLDLIKNIDDSGNIRVNVTSNDVSLQDINKETQEDIQAAGAIIREAPNAKRNEILITVSVIAIVILFTVIVYFLGWRNTLNFFKRFLPRNIISAIGQILIIVLTIIGILVGVKIIPS